MAGEAASGGQVLSYQADALCKCTDALIRLTRLQMDIQFQIANGQRYDLPWLGNTIELPPAPKAIAAPPSAKPEVAARKESTRLQQLRNQLGEYDAKLDGELSESERTALESKRKFTADRIAHFEKLEAEA